MSLTVHRLVVVAAVVGLSAGGCRSPRPASPPPRRLMTLSGVVVDGLEHAIAGAKVEVLSGVDFRPRRRAALKTDAHGRYEVMSPPRGPNRWVVRISKPGYTTASYAWPSRSGEATTAATSTLFKRCDSTQVDLLERLDGPALRDSVLELLASNPDDSLGFLGAFFRLEDHVRGSVREAARDPRVAARAVLVLSLAARPEDVEELLGLDPQFEGALSDKVARGWLAGALVHPGSSRAWLYLSDCLALRHSLHAFNAAVSALVANGTSRARDLLAGSLQSPHTTGQMDALIKGYRMLSARDPDPFLPDLAESIHRIARRISMDGSDQPFEQAAPVFSRRRDKALVHLRFPRAAGAPTYAACFHRQDGVWVPMGVWLALIH